ncbi:MAG: hypothetical protein RIG62_00715 [Cyclobacteriaceae bacterium]
METQPFYKSTLEPVSVWSRLTGQRSEKNAIIEINNLLSEKPVLEISSEDVQSILNGYQLNLYTDFRDGSLRELYKTYLRYCFDDNHLDEDEIQRLKHLKRLLGLSEQDVEMAHHRVCQEIYERELNAALEDHRLDAKERRFLRDLQTQLQLPPQVADRLYQHKAQTIILQFIKGAIADERLSPEEESELQTLINHLQVTPRLDEATQKQLAKYRLLWQVENGEVPTIFVPIKLQREEKCYFLANAICYDDPSNPKQKPLGKPLHAQLQEGTYWKPSAEQVPPDVKEKSPTTGKLYLTSERLIYRAEDQEKSIRLSNIIAFQAYSDGLCVYKDKGRNVILAMKEQADVLAILLGRILRDLQ